MRDEEKSAKLFHEFNRRCAPAISLRSPQEEGIGSLYKNIKMYLDPASREMSGASHIRSSMMVCVSQGRVCVCVRASSRFDHCWNSVVSLDRSSYIISSPRRCTYPYGGGAVGIIHRLAAETILVPPSAHEALRCERNVQSCFHTCSYWRILESCSQLRTSRSLRLADRRVSSRRFAYDTFARRIEQFANDRGMRQ